MNLALSPDSLASVFVACQNGGQMIPDSNISRQLNTPTELIDAFTKIYMVAYGPQIIVLFFQKYIFYNKKLLNFELRTPCGRWLPPVARQQR